MPRLAAATVFTKARRFIGAPLQTPNELPQPHVFAACGLLNTKPLPLSPSLKSSTVPER